MTNRYEIYKCDICGNVVEVLMTGEGELVCCGEPMLLEEPKTGDMLGEKHVPVFESINDKVVVKVGEVPHPMEETHYIQMIEVFSNDVLFRKFLEPKDEPEFKLDCYNEFTHAREYCNIHGLWTGKNKLI